MPTVVVGIGMAAGDVCSGIEAAAVYRSRSARVRGQRACDSPRLT